MYGFCSVLVYVTSFLGVALALIFVFAMMYRFSKTEFTFAKKVSVGIFAILAILGVRWLICAKPEHFVWVAAIGVVSFGILWWLNRKTNDSPSETMRFYVILWYVLLWLVCICYKICDDYCRQYEWDNAAVYTVVGSEEKVVKENDYIPSGQDDGALLLIGESDVTYRYVRLNNGQSYCIERQKGSQKTVYLKDVKDTVRVYNGRIVSKP